VKSEVQSVSDDDAWKKLLEHVLLVLIWRRKVYSDWEDDVTSSGKAWTFLGICKDRRSGNLIVCCRAILYFYALHRS